MTIFWVRGRTLRQAVPIRRKNRNFSLFRIPHVFDDFFFRVARSVAKMNQAMEAKRNPDLNLSASILPRKWRIGKTRQRARLAMARVPNRMRCILILP
jgi:hypothetical protein